MTYNFSTRLTRNSVRFKEINVLLATIIRGATTLSNIPVSPIHKNAEEVIPGIAVTRVEYQQFGIDVVDLSTLFPPLVGDKIVLPDLSEYRVISPDDATPSYSYATGQRTRVLVNTDMIKAPG